MSSTTSRAPASSAGSAAAVGAAAGCVPSAVNSAVQLAAQRVEALERRARSGGDALGPVLLLARGHRTGAHLGGSRLHAQLVRLALGRAQNLRGARFGRGQDRTHLLARSTRDRPRARLQLVRERAQMRVDGSAVVATQAAGEIPLLDTATVKRHEDAP